MIPRRTEHGNPVILLPPRHGEGRIDLRSEDHNLVWTSHALASGDDSVRVDVWSGRFVGGAEGWAMLPAGQFHALWRGGDGAVLETETFAVAERVLFDGHDTSDGWIESQILLSSGKLGTARLREGAMHGVLTAEFTTQQTPKIGDEWGLVARHYNAYHHLRVVCSVHESQLAIRLIRYAGTPPDLATHSVVAEAKLLAPTLFPLTIAWAFNGSQHTISLCGQQVLQASDGYMGGVEIVGCFAGGSVHSAGAAMHTTQRVLRHRITQRRYAAEIRPGNIDRLFLLESEMPQQNVAWESGIQFGHIGGAEIKFTQAAELTVMHEGALVTMIGWSGPMPKFFEQAEDVRGFARGVAHFYADQIVIADNVLTLTDRSVGPDIDLLGRLLGGPARLAVAGETSFRDFPMLPHGEMSFAKLADTVPTYPAAIAIPLRLGKQTWWLKVLVLLRAPENPPAAIFAWQCPHGLTASHDFRCTPTIPGREYAFTIAVAWHHSDTSDAVECDLLRWRNEWTFPMQIKLDGKTVFPYATLRDAPADAQNLIGCFDRASGTYVIPFTSDPLTIEVDPRQVARQRPIFVFRGTRSSSAPMCTLDGLLLSADKHFTFQYAGNDLWLQLLSAITKPTTLTIEFGNSR